MDISDIIETPADVENETEEQLSPAEKLKDLTAKAIAEYAVKHYNEAAELYSQATELQAEINGEMAMENADLLYAYGKCLYFLAQQTSNVLGGDAAAASLKSTKPKAPKKKKANGVPNGENSKPKLEAVSEEAETPALVDVVKEEDVKPDTEAAQEDKPLFQISGDTEDWDESDEEEEEEAEGDGEEQDDFTDAFEMLDIARVLYLRKLDDSEQKHLEESDKGKYVSSIDQTADVKQIKTRIADIHDLQAEVSLEGEKYQAAVDDLQKCLALQEELQPPESSLLAECHFKLSLALEFSSQSQKRDEQGNPVGEIDVDWKIRNEAIVQQEKAIDSCKLRISKETKEAEALPAGEAKDKAMANIEDVQEMVAEMDQRLADLRKPPIDVKAETAMREQMAGVLGTIIGQTEEEQKAVLAKAAGGATDINSLIKKKKPRKVEEGGDSGFGSAASTPAPEPSKVSGKRKADDLDAADVLETKKAKVEDAEDSGL